MIINFSDEPVTFELPGEWTVQVASDGQGEGQRYAGTIAGSVALLLTSPARGE